MHRRLIILLLLATPALAQMPMLERKWSTQINQLSPALTRGLVAYWSYQNGNWWDNYQNRSNFNGLATMAWSNGVAGGGAGFNGTTSNLYTADADAFSIGNGTSDSPCTFSYWAWGGGCVLAKTDNVTSGNAEWGTFMDVHPYEIFYDDSGAAYKIATSSGSTITGTWNHVVFVYNPPAFTSYINGTNYSVSVVTGGTYVAQHNTTISVRTGVWLMNRPANRGWYFGRLDEIRMYNVAKTAEEAAALMRAAAWLKDIGR